MKRQQTQWDAFLSLTWYEVALRFLFTFVAKTSEVLLAAGLVVSTANFLTDGSILATYPGVSIAWAWAQALAIDSSLGISLSYALQCLKQEEWIRGALYGLLTLLLAGVAGGITNVDIVSHALHLSMNDAMVQMGINVAILSRLRAIAVIGFILMSRLRDLPMMDLRTKTEPEPQRFVAPASGPPQEPRFQTVIQSLCSQFSGEEVAQILNACIVEKKIALVRMTPNGLSEPRPPQVDQPRQSHSSEHLSEPGGTGAIQEEPKPVAVPSSRSEPVPVPSMERARKAPIATEPSLPEEYHTWKDPGPIVEVPSMEMVQKSVPAREPLGGDVVPLESDGVPPHQRLEQAYQSLVAEGKKPSGRALAERAHVHRSTCVEWLRERQQQASENKQLEEGPEHDDLSLPDDMLDSVMTDLSEKVLEHEIAAVRGEPPDPSTIALSEMEMSLYGVAGERLPGIFPDSSLPGDTPDA